MANALRERLDVRGQSTRPSIWNRPDRLGYVLLAPTLFVVAGLSAVPMAYSLWLVFHRFNPLRPGPAEFIGAANLQHLLTDPRVGSALKTTFVYAGIAVPLSFVLGLCIALLYNNEFPGVRLFRGLSLVPLMVMPVAVGLTFQMLFNYQYGLFNWILVGLLHLPRLQWLSDPSLAFVSVIILDLWQHTPFAMMVLLAGLRGVPPEPIEAARVDGASGWQTFVHVILPFLRPLILVVLLLRFIGAFKLFDEIYALTQAGRQATETLAYYVYVLGFQAFDLGYASTVAYLLLVSLAVIGIMLIVRLEREHVV